MEDLLGFIFVIVAIVSSIAKNNKKKQQAQARKAVRREIGAGKQTKAPYSMEALRALFEEETQSKPVAEPAEPAVTAGTGSLGGLTHEGIHPCDEHPAEPGQVAQPRVQARVQVTEKPQVVAGSMQTDTHEGVHPCDEHDAAPLRTAPLITVEEEPGLRLEWTGENMVKAFIMQEVLTRPCQRRRA